MLWFEWTDLKCFHSHIPGTYCYDAGPTKIQGGLIGRYQLQQTYHCVTGHLTSLSIDVSQIDYYNYKQHGVSSFGSFCNPDESFSIVRDCVRKW